MSMLVRFGCFYSKDLKAAAEANRTDAIPFVVIHLVFLSSIFFLAFNWNCCWAVGALLSVDYQSLPSLHRQILKKTHAIHEFILLF